MALVRAIQRASEWAITKDTLPSHRIYQYIQLAYDYTVLSPLARLYLYGPSLGGWGFWNGMDLSMICAQKTNISLEFWQTHSAECIQLISRHFYGIVVLVETLFYFIIMWALLRWMGHRLNKLLY